MNCGYNVSSIFLFVLQIIFLAIAAMASARPQSFDEFGQVREFIPIIAESRSEPVDGSYAFDFESANGIVRSETGSPGINGGTFQQGSWR